MNTLYKLWNQIRFILRSRSRNNPEKDDVATNYDRTTKTFIFFVLAVDIFVVVYLSICPCAEGSTSNAILSFLIASSAILIGGILLGFLFGIPKKHKLQGSTSVQPATPPPVISQTSYYDDNTNLEEISDWLTKIIIGLSLVQFKEIKSEMTDTAENIGKAFVCIPDAAGYVIGFSTIIFFGGIGLMFGYLWARIKLVLLLTDNRNKQSRLELDFMNSSNRKTIDQAQVDAKQASIAPAGSQWFFGKVNELYNSKPVLVYDDLQKNRWGGRPENEGFALSAKVTTGILGLFDLELIFSARKELEVQQVAFFLHDTFPKEVVVVQIVNKVAKLNLTAYEAFTVGAVVFEGDKPIELELDLNIPLGYPANFYYKS